MSKTNPRFGGPVIFLNRNDINTDEIIPAKYLTEITKIALKPHLLEDLKLSGFDSKSKQLEKANVVITRSNFGCGSSREHAVWAFEVNGFNTVIGEKPIARIFRQNCYNCGILAIELPKEDISNIFRIAQHNHNTKIAFNNDLSEFTLLICDEADTKVLESKIFPFTLNDYDRSLIGTGGWLNYADKCY